MKNNSINYLYKKFEETNGVSIDSRSIKNDQLFFALKGPNFDGHKYIINAKKNGAKYAVIDDESYSYFGFTILVSDVEKALQDLARYHRMFVRIPVIGLTGSNGKTTTKELIYSVLSEKFNVLATIGNLNNHLGVPLSILRIDKNHEIAIIEMGANKPLEIEFLSRIAMPDIGIITNIGKAHLEGFINIEGVLKAKTELYKYLESTKGKIFYNLNEERLINSLPNSTDNIPYSIDDIDVFDSFPTLSFNYKEIRFTSQLSGRFNAFNIMTAIKIGEYFDLTISQIKSGIENYNPQNNRSQIKITDKNTLILDAYNANPSSMKASILNVANSLTSGDKVLILGHMLELGESSKSEHAEIIQYIQKWDWTQVILVGSEFINITVPQKFDCFTDVTECIDTFFSEKIIVGSTVLLKGSRGATLEKLVPYL
ncbi:MAG: UDP-N-acetylmuramoyl-tripeptide--D-alanyl-D-alanine ligase [Saprospiraceae bacterium]